MAKIATNLGRSFPGHVVCYLAKTVAYNTPGIATDQTVVVGHLPEGAITLPSYVKVTTAFNAGSTNVLTVGTDTGSDEIIDAATSNMSIDETSATFQQAILAGGYVVGTGGEVVYVRYVQTGTAASTGAATVIIPYIPRVG